MAIAKLEDEAILTRAEVTRRLVNQGVKRHQLNGLTKRQIATFAGAKLLSNFGTRLREAVAATGLEITELAEQVGTTRQTIGAWTQRASPPRGKKAREEITKIAQLANFRSSWVMAGTGEHLASEKASAKGITPEMRDKILQIEPKARELYRFIQDISDLIKKE